MSKAVPTDRGTVAANGAAARAFAGVLKMSPSTIPSPMRFQLVVDGDVVAEAPTRAELERAARRCASYERVSIQPR